jgi:epoxyqueuosine reductase
VIEERNEFDMTSDKLIAQALALGAFAAGVLPVEAMNRCQSEQFEDVHGPFDNSLEGQARKETKEQSWRSRAQSLLVIALSHPRGEPELDWWSSDVSGGTNGNHRLISINNALVSWLGERGIEAFDLAYYPFNGGIHLKDAAVLGGLGVVGRNNLLLITGLGPRHRLRCLAINKELQPSSPNPYAPCLNCDAPCRKVCPQKAFGGDEEHPELAPVNGYQRNLCGRQLRKNRELSAKKNEHTHYCRRCEFACKAK